MFILCILLLASSSLAENVEDDTNQRDYSEREFFEGDLLLSRNEIKEITNNVGGARGLTRNRQWPGGIVHYTINTWNPIKIAVIHSAIREWEEFTCIRFKKRTNQKDYVEFFAGKGCYSESVGRKKNGGRHRISLGFGCITHGIAVHEIGHVLGFWHEQSRPDRDQYVYIYWPNIKPGQRRNFHKYSHGTIDSLGSTYDYKSIMHYGKHEFATYPWLVTLTAINGASIGQRRHLSKLDREQMNKYYNCNKK